VVAQTARGWLSQGKPATAIVTKGITERSTDKRKQEFAPSASTNGPEMAGLTIWAIHKRLTAGSSLTRAAYMGSAA